jgi:hypothetical protein
MVIILIIIAIGHLILIILYVCFLKRKQSKAYSIQQIQS